MTGPFCLGAIVVLAAAIAVWSETETAFMPQTHIDTYMYVCVCKYIARIYMYIERVGERECVCYMSGSLFALTAVAWPTASFE